MITRALAQDTPENTFGFYLGKTASELFGFPLLWSNDGYLPEYLTLICGLFHNGKMLSPGAVINSQAR